METEVEVAELKNRIARLEEQQRDCRQQLSSLEQQLREVQHFLNVSRPRDPGEPPVLLINCSGIYLRHPENPNQLQGFLSASAEGPCLSLFGADEKARLSMFVGKEGARLQFFSQRTAPAAEVWVEEETGRGHVQVYEAGKPRALMKAAKEGGIVGVVHDDGHSRAFMIGSETEGGEIMAVTPDMQAGVKISASSPGGGYITVNHSNGKAGVIIACTPASGAVVVNDARGKVVASLPPAHPQGTSGS